MWRNQPIPAQAKYKLHTLSALCKSLFHDIITISRHLRKRTWYTRCQGKTVLNHILDSLREKHEYISQTFFIVGRRKRDLTDHSWTKTITWIGRILHVLDEEKNCKADESKKVSVLFYTSHQSIIFHTQSLKFGWTISEKAPILGRQKTALLLHAD